MAENAIRSAFFETDSRRESATSGDFVSSIFNKKTLSDVQEDKFNEKQDDTINKPY